MTEYLLIAVVAALVTYCTVPFVRWLAIRIGAITPVRGRDVHALPIPRLGGMAMLLGFAAAALVGSRLPYLSQLFDTSEIKGVLLGAAAITLLGAIDDVRELDWLTKLAGQVLAAGAMAFFGVQLLSLPILGVATILPQPLLLVLTVLIVVVSTNAVNFVDGLDGLAAGVVAIAAGAFFAWSYLVSQDFDPPNVFSTGAFITAALGGICVGFLPHNFHPARLFMGDAGALLLGLLLAAATISMTGTVSADSEVTQTSATAALLLPLLLPVAIIALPVADMAFAVIRRTRAGQAPWRPDAKHIHHRMLRIGHTHRRAVLLLYAWSGLIAIGAVSFAFIAPERALIAIGAGLLIVVVLTWRPWRPRPPRGGARVPSDAPRDHPRPRGVAGP